MKKLLLLLNFIVCGMAFSEQFRISEYNGENLSVEVPACFDGAYLFVEQCTNLASGVWKAIDYSQVNLGSPQSMKSDVYKVTLSVVPKENVAKGVIGSVFETVKNAPHVFYRTVCLSFVDSDGDGVSNDQEFANHTDPYTSDISEIVLPEDDGDPRPIPGSVDSSPGDWNMPVTNAYRCAGSAWQMINALTLALDGSNGVYTAQTDPEVMGAWIDSKCNGTWEAAEDGFAFPTVSDGSFYRTETDAFQWTGKEKIYPLALTACDGTVQFLNHLIQAAPSDPAGLAVLADGASVLVDEDNPWTEEKLTACLKHLTTVKCRLQKVSGGAFDAADTNAMAQASYQFNDGALRAGSSIRIPVHYTQVSWAFDMSQGGWYITGTSSLGINQQFTFLNSLQKHGFGPTKHIGLIAIEPSHDWLAQGVGLEKTSLQTNVAPFLVDGQVSQAFSCTDGEVSWFVSGSTNYATLCPQETGGHDGLVPADLGYGDVGMHQVGYFPYDYDVLSTLDLPDVSVQTLVMDSNRDGVIGTNDFGRVDPAHPYRFWVNEDENKADYTEADMEDFFPAMFKGTDSNQTFKLSANVKLNYIQTTMTPSDSQKYLHDIDLAQEWAGQIQKLDVNDQTSEIFNESNLVLLASSEVNTNAELYVHILEGGTEVEVATNYFSFSSVTNMYRIKNLRAGGVSSLDPPANWPDELTNGKDVLFVHGFNVKDDYSLLEFGELDTPARLWNRNIFKRLWFAGSNAKYHGVIWDGTPSSYLGKTHYHHSVINAFATAPYLADYCNELDEPVVIAHSLGNMVTGSAIVDHNAGVSQYYALDVAVALEAYGDVAPTNKMVPDSLFATHDAGLLVFTGYRWDEYPVESWGSEWYQLFTNDVNDVRGNLTWRHRFGDIQQRTDMFNFYSSTEDVLRIGDEIGLADLVVEGHIMKVIPTGFNHNGTYAWQIQEMYKGLDQVPFINAPGGGISKYAGWGFVKSDSQHIESHWAGVLGHAPVAPFVVSNALNQAGSGREDYRESLKTDPLFRHSPEKLFGADAYSFARGTIGSQGGSLEYHEGDHDLDISKVPIRDWLLAKAFPSRTGPMGSGANKAWDDDWNFDMSTQFMTDTQRWYNSDKYLGRYTWHHSDWRNSPYVYVYKLFEEIVTKEN